MIAEFSKFWSKSLIAMPGGGELTVGHLILVFLLLIAGYYTSRLAAFVLQKRLSKTKMRPDAIYALSRIVFWLILIFVSITIMSLLSIPLTAFAFISGAVAIGVGFGAQNIINNFISGWILMTERPIRIDDFIEIEGMQGIVERIGNRSTRIRRTDGVHLLVPNSKLLETTVINWTLIDQAIRTTVRVGVAYGSPVRKVADLISQAVREQPEVKPEPPPFVIFEDFGDNALVFDAYFWRDAAGEKDTRAVRSAIRFRVCELFAENDIVVAFPQRDVHLDALQPVPVRVINDDKDKLQP